MKLPDENIKAYWDRKGEELKTDQSATMKDVILRSMEIEAICSRLHLDDTLLDIGCGNAFGSLIFAEHCESVLGVDFSEKMIDMAREAIAASGKSNIKAEHGNLSELSSSYHEAFSVVSSVRCLINLPHEEQQHAAINELAKVVAPGGRLFLIEGISEHFDAMNTMRVQVGLKPITLDWHNLLFNKKRLEKALNKVLTIEEAVDFGEYYFQSRVVHPLMVFPDEPKFESRINRAAKRLWQKSVVKGQFTYLSTLVLYISRKASK